MQHIPLALEPLARYAQFILYRLVPNSKTGKLDKIPMSPHTTMRYPKDGGWQADPNQWASAEQACSVAQALGPDYGVGFLFTEQDPFWFLDIDACLVDGQWSPLANNLMACLPGCAVEVSSSGNGLHLFGTGSVPPHACKNTQLNCEFYHTGRFVALTGLNTVGSAEGDYSAHLPAVVATYFPPRTDSTFDEWTAEPVEYYTSTESDAELITRACEAGGANALFGRGVSFADLWTADEAKLGAKWPSDKDDAFDGSSADMALAQHLAFWTGSNCERMKALMLESGLVRDKWERDGYLDTTISKACGMQSNFYSVREPVATVDGAAKLTGSPQQIPYAEALRAQKLAGATAAQQEVLLKEADAQLWINAKDKNTEEVVAALSPTETTEDIYSSAPIMLSGDRYLDAEGQREYFKGCAYVTSENGIYTPGGGILNKEQFNSVMAGYDFELGVKKKDTSKPWDAFVGSAIIRWPRVHRTCFRPRTQTGVILTEGGTSMVNTYRPIDVPSQPGDVALFTQHLHKLLPHGDDADKLLAYMAALVQHKGCKFQWAPFIQGVEGNGKSLIAECVIEAIGANHIHKPKVSELGEKFNDWAFDKIFIYAEDMFVNDKKNEVIEILKPMITARSLAKRGMARGQEMQDLCSNWIIDSNHQDAYRKTPNDRRIAPFFCAQQSEEDLKRDGMDEAYFDKLYGWLRRDGGFAMVTHHLQTMDIAAELNPALEEGGHSARAPRTTSTDAAITAGRGTVEQEIIEQIDQCVPGFCGDFISSAALHNLLVAIRKDGAIPRNRRGRLIESLGYIRHPALPEGKATKHLDIDDGKRPQIYVKRGSLPAQIPGAQAATDAYVRAQTSTADVVRLMR